MSKTVYTARASFEIEVDPAKPETMTAAAEWMAKLAKGEVVTPPDKLPLAVTITGAPSIVNRREK